VEHVASLRVAVRVQKRTATTRRARTGAGPNGCAYRRRNEVESLLRRLNGYRCIVSRFEKHRRDVPRLHWGSRWSPI